MVTETERQAIVDEEHLRLLPIFYWVFGGFWGLYSLFIAGYFALIGTVFISIPFEDEGPPPEFGWIFIGIAVLVFVLMACFAASQVFAGFWMRQRKHRIATMVIAAVMCLSVPFGTLIGVLTLLVLARPSVRALYEASSGTAAPGAPNAEPPMPVPPVTPQPTPPQPPEPEQPQP